MKTKYYLFIILMATGLKSFGQTIHINSIATVRQPAGDCGYTLDGTRMQSSRQKLLNPANFGPSGTYHKDVVIYNNFELTETLEAISSVPKNHIFFFGSFNTLHGSTQQFTNEEIDAIYDWSLRGGKVIIAEQGTVNPYYNSAILDNKWGFVHTIQTPSFIFPTVNGNNTDIFNGPFGSVESASEGGSAQGHFISLTEDADVLATDAYGNPLLFLDCRTQDLIISDVDAFTDLGGISAGADINNTQDKFWANVIVFMDRLSSYPSNCPDSLSMPNVFTPGNDGFNDYFNPITITGYSIEHISIYNRWGNLIHEQKLPSILWDGKVNDKIAESGIYYWLMECKKADESIHIKKGYVHLLR
jgi:gliding motility-associated-like protein